MHPLVAWVPFLAAITMAFVSGHAFVQLCCEGGAPRGVLARLSGRRWHIRRP